MWFSSSALAQSELAGSIHLGLDASFVSYIHGETEPEGSNVDFENDIIEVGYPTAVGARVGYVPVDGLEFGAALALSFESHDDDGDDYSSGSYDIKAYLRYVAPGRNARFFAGPTIGGEFFRNSDPGDFGDDDFEQSGSSLVLGLDAGLYGFVTPSLSIDPFVGFRYFSGSVEVGDDFDESEADVSGFGFMAGVSLSGWLDT